MYIILVTSRLATKISILTILFIQIILQGYLLAQTDAKDYIGVSFGGSDFHIKDDHVSPLIFSSLGIAPSIQYFHKGENSLHYFEAAYFDDYLTTSAENFTTINHRGRLRYSYLHSVTDLEVFQKEIKLFLGGAVSTYLCHSDYYFRLGNRDARANESWYWNNSLDFSIYIDYDISAREFLSAQIFIPVVSNVSRPNYSSSINFNYNDNDWKFKMFGETKFITDNFSSNAVIAYQRPLFWRINLQLNYEFYFSTYNEPKEIKMYMNNFRAGLFFCF